ncbi:nitrite reductase (NADH) small subunit [Panacagrimonas perspica]|uniref:Nitrite reductase (NADH) small subunit n=1 Tax=Panacagrimonas perspica TaxID=381431 RepID=A0A4S3K3J6_9GAMM|nr:Rieske 2Fe-2S domain-containing protein [Panacagrimonas perspica]TDU28879.1 nitrite reductase (NADH) small subunit [Panacagrimonas perspica]THD02294.1 hypothetical protein B1810_15310 [Panacagrimonas perspica]
MTHPSTPTVGESAAAGTWLDAGAADEVWQGEMVGVSVGGAEVLLLGLDGGVRAYEDKCPHNGGLLSKGEFCDGVVVCTRHQWEFCARTGVGLNPADTKLKEIPIRVVSGRIEVLVEDGAAR